MHEIGNPGDLLPNGLDDWDVNGDGLSDFLTNYEMSGNIRIAFHPGANIVRSVETWQTVIVGKVANAESSCFVDIEGDGISEVAVAHGIEHTGETSGIRIFKLNDGVWCDLGDIPASDGGWQLNFITAEDVDSDGDKDILAGGRASRIAGGSKTGDFAQGLDFAGIRWFENPGRNMSGDLSLWKGHAVDDQAFSGHGFALGDLDGDGDIDIADCDADWDTPDDKEAVYWYENHLEDGVSWEKHLLLKDNSFYGKEQTVIVDMDGDGKNDILVQSEASVLLFTNKGNKTFTLSNITKPEEACWRTRMLAAADINGDGKLDIIGALIHQDGSLPKKRTAIYWMENKGGSIFQTHAIKYGDGFLGLGVFNGEKWDLCIPYDMDGDGDLDIVADCEEYNRLRAIISVVWFENPLL